MRKKKRVPFKESLLRFPGQSLDEDIQDLLDKMDEILLIPFALALDWCYSFLSYEKVVMCSPAESFPKFVCSGRVLP
ncbi:MAG: hypothetical protein ABSA46_22385 [Thermodesulfovibrionales bacterium]|jgi:hypothetical protein